MTAMHPDLRRDDDSLPACPLFQPSDHSVVPQDAVVWFLYPVALVGEVQQLARNPAPLECGECADSLTVRDSQIMSAVNDEHRHTPLAHVIQRIEFLIIRWLVVLSTTVFMVLEPEFIGRIRHHARVEHTVVIHHAFPRFIPDTGHPVHHVAAVARTKCTGFVTIEERVTLERRGPTLLEIFERRPAPIAGNLVCE